MNKMLFEAKNKNARCPCEVNDENVQIPKVQRILKKLIAEEKIAYDIYFGCVMSTCKCQEEALKPQFMAIASDELNDHYKKLVEWAKANKYKIPFKLKDIETAAEPQLLRLLDKVTHKKELQDYLQIAIESEHLAIESYLKALENEDLPDDFAALLTSIYYDELQHRQELSNMLCVIQSGAAFTYVEQGW